MDDIWIGAESETGRHGWKGYIWKWHDGSHIKTGEIIKVFQNFRTGPFPEQLDEGCGVMKADGRWSWAECREEKGFVCHAQKE